MSRAARSHPLVLACALAAAGAVAALLGGWRATGKLEELLFGAAVTLVFGATLGGIISLLLDNARKLQERRREQARFVQAVLDDLKGAHDRVERVHIMMGAYPSVPAYGKGMRELLEAKIGLRNVERALETDAQPWSEPCVTEIARMRTYAGELVNEYAANYARLRDAHEADARAAREQLGALERFGKFRTRERPGYDDEFGDPLRRASEILRQRLRRAV
jgi:hypothetical protein